MFLSIHCLSSVVPLSHSKGEGEREIRNVFLFLCAWEGGVSASLNLYVKYVVHHQMLRRKKKRARDDSYALVTFRNERSTTTTCECVSTVRSFVGSFHLSDSRTVSHSKCVVYAIPIYHFELNRVFNVRAFFTYPNSEHPSETNKSCNQLESFLAHRPATVPWNGIIEQYSCLIIRK